MISWKNLLEQNYIQIFNTCCTQCNHYLDTITGDMGLLSLKGNNENYGLTSLEEDLFLPKGMYVGQKIDKIPIVFNHGCSVAINTNKKNFQGSLVAMNKIMMGLGTTAKV